MRERTRDPSVERSWIAVRTLSGVPRASQSELRPPASTQPGDRPRGASTELGCTVRQRKLNAARIILAGRYFFAGALAPATGLRSNAPSLSTKNRHSEALSQEVVCW